MNTLAVIHSSYTLVPLQRVLQRCAHAQPSSQR
jgi:hypothetical protein